MEYNQKNLQWIAQVPATLQTHDNLKWMKSGIEWCYF